MNDFFEISKIEAYDYNLNNERINMTELTKDMILSFYSSFKDKNIEPGITVGSDDVFIMNDRGAVMRVLENLLSNALRYSEGDIEIVFKQQNGEVVFQITNSAEIIDEADNPELFFDRFYIADKSRTEQSTGLGLAVTKSLIDKMNGEISAGYDGGYLTFTCRWPAD